MTREVTILADDLTGAADAAVGFAAAGMETWLSLDDAPSEPAASVLAVDTDTRTETAEVAFARTRAAAREAIRARSRVVYKKIDSTLRGHVGPEIAAVLAAAIETGDVLGLRPIVLLSPAFPALGRVVRAGRVLVEGIALEAAPITLLASAGLAAAPVGTTADASALAREIERRAEGGADAVVCDAESDAGLQAIAEAGARLTRPVVWAGSGGLARHLPRALRLGVSSTSPVDAPDWTSIAPLGPILILAGSPSDVAQRQAAELAREVDVTTVTIARDVLREGDGAPAWHDTAARIDGALAAGRDTCVVLERDAGTEPTIDSGLARALGQMAAVAAPLGTLIVTGGDTARAALKARGISRLRVWAELEPGVPVCTTQASRPLRVVTKAGGFGDAGTLVRLRRRLRSVAARSLVR
jgi:uncharacterized protein YgbK (DUF1537 family)